MDVLEWLQQWYLAQCNGDWEHGNSIHVTTLDNPGWKVAINLNGTSADGASMQPYVGDLDEADWVRCEIRDGLFVAYGDAGKLRFILELFRSVVSQ